jgi:hypothetical protein
MEAMLLLLSCMFDYRGTIFAQPLVVYANLVARAQVAHRTQMERGLVQAIGFREGHALGKMNGSD